MPKLTVVVRSGAERTLESRTGISLMEALRDNGFDDILAICGGSCACATCHVYVDPAFAGGLTPMKADEEDLLSGLSHSKPESRLSCQMMVTSELDGLRLTIAPEE
ncbi:MAG TPA: 2Fe-2S iron-sulfur cluster-binding protein [Rhizomicrobium sp.]|jgi:2Fe-2S ferredoxin|nr:2Fe-2S iron-sulfur cluster-binding protein [Rhizomicrobium sp.]